MSDFELAIHALGWSWVLIKLWELRKEISSWKA